MKFALLSALTLFLAATSSAQAACFYLSDDTYVASSAEKNLDACKRQSASWGVTYQFLFVTSGPGFKIYMFINNGNVTDTKMFPSN